MRRWLLLMCGVATALLAACGSTAAPPPAPSPTQAVAAPVPDVGSCHQLSWAQAVAQAVPAGAVSCTASHTSETYAVGQLQTVYSGHLLAISSPRVQQQVTAACPAALTKWLGGTTEQLRLSMLRPAWFTPTAGQEAAGAHWYRCDVVAVSGDDTLAPLTSSLAGVLGGPKAGDWAMCGTAKPGTTGFARVPCSTAHTWRALSVVDITPGAGGAYPGEAVAKAAGDTPCKDAGRNVAKDALNYQWGYDWPSAQQWAAGQTYGVCWAPA